MVHNEKLLSFPGIVKKRNMPHLFATIQKREKIPIALKTCLRMIHHAWFNISQRLANI